MDDIFDESSNGWSSRKSYTPENGISIDTKLYSFKNGLIYEHGKNPLYNNFYGIQYDSSLTFVFNEEFKKQNADLVVSQHGKILFNEKGNELYFGTIKKPIWLQKCIL